MEFLFHSVDYVSGTPIDFLKVFLVGSTCAPCCERYERTEWSWLYFSDGVV